MYGHENEKSVNVLLEGQTMEMRRSIIGGSFLIFDTPILLYLVQWGLVFMNGFLLVRIAQFLQVSEHTFMMNCRLSSTKGERIYHDQIDNLMLRGPDGRPDHVWATRSLLADQIGDQISTVTRIRLAIWLSTKIWSSVVKLVSVCIF